MSHRNLPDGTIFCPTPTCGVIFEDEKCNDFMRSLPDDMNNLKEQTKEWLFRHFGAHATSKCLYTRSLTARVNRNLKDRDKRAYGAGYEGTFDHIAHLDGDSDNWLQRNLVTR